MGIHMMTPLYELVIKRVVGTIDLTVAQGSDDCARVLSDDYWNLTHEACWAGARDIMHIGYGSGMRFQNITIPKGATIKDAYLTLVSTTTANKPTKSRISAEAVDDAPTFADDKAAFDTRWANRTAQVDWDDDFDWTMDLPYNSPDIKSVIQAIIDRPGWVSGNDIVIFWEDFEARSPTDVDARARVFAYANVGGKDPPKLHIEYEG